MSTPVSPNAHNTALAERPERDGYIVATTDGAALGCSFARSTGELVMNTVSTWAQQADSDLRAVEDDPAARLEFARSFFTKHPDEHLQEFGNSELAFMEWEVRRGCLNPLTDPGHAGSPWWRAVNGALLRDAREAHLLFDEGRTSAEGLASNPGVQRWLEFMEKPSAAHWYLAHNTSITAGYLRFADMAANERGHEQKLMNLVLYRVLFTQAVVDDQRWTFGWLGGLLRGLVSPTSRMVAIVVNRRDLYPATYPLSEEDCRTLDRRFNHLGNVFVSVIDMAVIGGQLPRLYDYAATTLDTPDLRAFNCRHMACYPWGVRMNPYELDAIRSSDRPSLPVRMISRVIHGFTGR